ncbi:hypothetical protein EI555_003570 [Monodon monoceros]|uniref:Uncharacterized protein n=1 Tax=Monodon monoceros TaxID=40151 RepID=A0A4U1F7H1_MONMO|nr:hypothetical protein EI555_003570 [Monodon monoceros]
MTHITCSWSPAPALTHPFPSISSWAPSGRAAGAVTLRHEATRPLEEQWTGATPTVFISPTARLMGGLAAPAGAVWEGPEDQSCLEGLCSWTQAWKGLSRWLTPALRGTPRFTASWKRRPSTPPAHPRGGNCGHPRTGTEASPGLPEADTSPPVRLQDQRGQRLRTAMAPRPPPWARCSPGHCEGPHTSGKTQFQASCPTRPHEGPGRQACWSSSSKGSGGLPRPHPGAPKLGLGGGAQARCEGLVGSLPPQLPSTEEASGCLRFSGYREKFVLEEKQSK